MIDERTCALCKYLMYDRKMNAEVCHNEQFSISDIIQNLDNIPTVKKEKIMAMTNAEWMIKNGYDFLRLDVKRVSGDSYAIMFDDKVKDTIRINDTVINALLTWLNKEHKEPILDDAERRYLSAVIRPFRKQVNYIEKSQNFEGEVICIGTKKRYMVFPPFEKGTMYKGMEPEKKYTLEELGL